jgi:hypothetical protein
MKWRLIQLLLLVCCAGPTARAASGVASEVTSSLGFVTNAPFVWEAWRISRVLTNSFPTNPVYLRRFTHDYVFTNRVFQSYLPGTLSERIWTNFIAHTNGHDLRIWSARSHPPDWPATAPSATWNTNSVIWGMKGVTALSPCWQGEGAPGQVPLTLLTRRHAYTRGHGMGPDGFNQGWAGIKAWFVTADNVVVEAKIKRSVVRVGPRTNGPPRDCTIMLFDRDLPETIETMSVALPEEMQTVYPYPTQGLTPHPFFQTEQGGYVSTGVAPLTVNTWKGGDSGSPNLIPLPGELVFVSGRSTSGPSPAMQEDMDELCRLEHLDPAKYQLHWVDLGKYQGR